MSNISEYGSDIRFDSVKKENVSDLKFYRTEDLFYAVWFQNNHDIYLSISIDCGKTFSHPQKIMSASGMIRDLQILARQDQFVVAIIETISNYDSKRAVSGWLNIEGKTFSFKPCTSHQIKGELVNMFLSFKGNESVDHIVTKTESGLIHEVAMGHSCSVRELKTMKITTARL